MKITNIDTQELLDHHIIDEEVANNIINYYLEKEGNKKKFLTNTTLPLCIVAALFIITGVCFLLADNWESIPHALQVVIGLLPIILGAASCYYVYKHQYESRAFKETAGIIYCIGLITTLCLINHIFGMEIDFPIYVFTLAILAYPIVFLFRSVITSSVIMTFLCISSTYTILDGRDLLSVVLYLIIFFIDLLFLYRTYHTEKDTFLVKFRTATLPLVLFFVIMWGHIALREGNTNEDICLMISSFFASACISYSLHTWIKQSTHIQSNASFLKATTYLANFIILAIFAFSVSADRKDENGPTEFPIIAIIQILLLELSFFMKWKRGLRAELDEWITLPLIPLVLVIPYAYFSYTFQSLILIYLAYLTFVSIRTMDVLKLNLALVGWYVFMLLTLFEYDQSIILIGTLSIVWGVVLILINLFISKKKSHGLQQNN
ncbi:MAG: DUF2157 domain-containing protein [Paludibacteraceae bacterium]|nr:DUF2157 domain-containing protein [Paludibacteraceae bacterium]